MRRPLLTSRRRDEACHPNGEDWRPSTTGRGGGAVSAPTAVFRPLMRRMLVYRGGQFGSKCREDRGASICGHQVSTER